MKWVITTCGNIELEQNVTKPYCWEKTLHKILYNYAYVKYKNTKQYPIIFMVHEWIIKGRKFSLNICTDTHTHTHTHTDHLLCGAGTVLRALKRIHLIFVTTWELLLFPFYRWGK